jgi:glycerol-3-phosphate dehydrogenase (NAD(P)+)
MKIAVLGAGAWGTALAGRLAEQAEVRLWTRNPEQAERMRQERVNARYLPGVTLPHRLAISVDLATAAVDADYLIAAVPTGGFRDLLRRLRGIGATAPVVWLCKGFEAGSMKLPHQVLEEELPGCAASAVLSGPSFAQEVAAEQPAALTLAAHDDAFARRSAHALHRPRLRLYSSTDVPGVEVGGAVKNVIAIAAGICDGLQLGHNARAALITRGLAEITRLAVAMGGQPRTLAGLAGLGDLVLTCTGDLSRNRTVGLELAKGRKLADIVSSMTMIAEGVETTQAAVELARAYQVDMPITQQMHTILSGGHSPREAIRELMERTLKNE